MPEKSKLNDAFRRARGLGCEYLLQQCRPDGGFGLPARGVADYYKVISALQTCGETRAANRLCLWIRSHGLMPNGDFGPRPLETLGYPYAYYNTWVVLGAHRLGQYDLSQRGMDFLMNFHDPISGGFYSSLTDRSESTLQDIWVVSGCGQAALATGRIEVARGVGLWMKEVMRQQPDYPRRLFGVFSRARGVHTIPDPAEEIRFVARQDATCDQYVFNPGIAGGFLCRLYQTTGETEWLELAKEYVLFAEGMSDFLWTLPRAGKVGWAASLLYTVTGNEKYLQMALRVGDELVQSQAKNGSWNWLPKFGKEMTNDLTAELVIWLDEILQAAAPSVSHRLPREHGSAGRHGAALTTVKKEPRRTASSPRRRQGSLGKSVRS